MPVQIQFNTKKLRRTLALYPHRLQLALSRGMKNGAKETAENIKKDFMDNPIGFKDRTGALRKSIVGDIKKVTTHEIIGAVGAGGDNIGSNGKRTREYVRFVEFGEFSQAGLTTFLRPGVLVNKKTIRDAMIKEANRSL